MAKDYLMLSGGGVIIERRQVVSRREWLDGDPKLRAELFEQNRLRLLRELEKEAKLPFAIAIQNIADWEEREESLDRAAEYGWLGIGLLPADPQRPVVLVTRCRVGRAEYRAGVSGE